MTTTTNNESRIHILRELMEANTDVSAYKIFKLKDSVGVICQSSDSEVMDEHCDECRQEVLAFNFKGPTSELPSFLFSCVGPTKFARIESGWRASTGLDLSLVEFV